MKVIFLDVDGVLNDDKSNSYICGSIGVDDKKVKLLRKIIESTNAVIVLSSSWRSFIHRGRLVDLQTLEGDYLERKLKRERLYIISKTPKLYNRGEEIQTWLNERNNIESWIVLDDEIFSDFEKCDILPYLVKTDFYNGGLKEEHVEQAIKMLNKEK